MTRHCPAVVGCESGSFAANGRSHVRDRTIG